MIERLKQQRENRFKEIDEKYEYEQLFSENDFKESTLQFESQIIPGLTDEPRENLTFSQSEIPQNRPSMTICDLENEIDFDVSEDTALLIDNINNPQLHKVPYQPVVLSSCD